MEKQGLKQASRNWLRGHVFWWTIYAVLVFATVNITSRPGFADWPMGTQIIIALLPALPVAIWLYVAGRFVARSPDELGVQNQLKATASAGAVTALFLFGAGWLETILQLGPFPAWGFVAVFGLTWMIQLGRFAAQAR